MISDFVAQTSSLVSLIPMLWFPSSSIFLDLLRFSVRLQALAAMALPFVHY